MSFENQTEKNVAYIDVRFHFNKETEIWTDNEGKVLESYTHFELGKVERKKLKGITEDEADSLGDSFFQMDDYQLFFSTEVPTVVCDGGAQKFRG